MEKKTLLQAKWENNELPGINCLAFGSGEVQIFNYFPPYDSGRENGIYLFCDTTIDSLSKYNPDIFTEIEINDPAQQTFKGNNLVCGAGSMGNEGFVAMRTQANFLIWAFFFNFSNPIWALKIIGDQLRCLSENKVEIIIDLQTPSIKTIIEHPYDVILA